MKIISWNINGVRAAQSKGLSTWLDGSGAHIVGFQEVRAKKEQIPAEILSPSGLFANFSAAQRPGYSGVGLLTKFEPEEMTTTLEASEFDIEGRVQIARFGNLVLANIYFPNGNGKERDNSRIPYKLAFYRRLFDVLEPFQKDGRALLVMGDFNTAHQEIDLARPKENKNTSGFCQNERDELSRWLANGYVDTFRHFEKGAGHYTWWSQRQNARERNVGWRIDYVLANEKAMAHVTNAFTNPHVQGSDHCPVGVEVNEKICSK